MPVSCKLINGKHRVIGPDGDVETQPDGAPVDGGGHSSAQACQAQASAINMTIRACMGQKSICFAAGGLFDEVSPEDIDRENGIIHNLSIAREGPVKGHGMTADSVFLSQVEKGGQQREPKGVRSRAGHVPSGSFGASLGRFHNFRHEGDRVRADLHLMEASSKSPLGDLMGYVLSFAEQDPDGFGPSLIADLGRPSLPENDLPHARLAVSDTGIVSLDLIDLVDQPAINEGAFSEAGSDEEEARTGFIGKIVASCMKQQHERKAKKMSDEKLKEAEAKLKAAEDKAKEDAEKLTASEKATEELKAAAVKADTDGQASVVARMKERMSQIDDREFIMETIELSDVDFLKASVKKLQTGDEGGTDGEPTAPFSAADDPDGKLAAAKKKDDDEKGTFEAKRDKIKEDEKLSLQAATGKAIGLHPELYEKYQARITASRQDKASFGGEKSRRV